MKRTTLINLHLAIASMFMPLLLLMPLSGTLYLLGYKGDQVTTEAFQTTGSVPEETEAQEQFFRDIFKQQNVDFDFAYVRASKNDFIFRPSTRVHYTAARNGDTLIFSRQEPNFLKKIIELHKGHGPAAMRIFEMFFGLALILTTLSGLWLAWTIPTYRKITLSAFSIGAVFILACLFI